MERIISGAMYSGVPQSVYVLKGTYRNTYMYNVCVFGLTCGAEIIKNCSKAQVNVPKSLK